jgi:hypothetical protein
MPTVGLGLVSQKQQQTSQKKHLVMGVVCQIERHATTHKYNLINKNVVPKYQQDINSLSIPKIPLISFSKETIF